MVEFGLGFVLGIATVCFFIVLKPNESKATKCIYKYKVEQAISLIREYQYHEDQWNDEKNKNYDELLNVLEDEDEY